MPDAAQDAAAGIVDDVLGTAPEAPQEAEQDQAVVQAAEEPDVEGFDLSPDLPPDLQAEMDEPDFSYDDDPEPVYTEPVSETEDEYEDPAVQVERNKRIAAERKLAWVEEQKLNTDRKRWAEKDGKFFPLVVAEDIAAKATSRREFARLAKAENDRLAPIVSRALEAERAKMGQQTQTRQAELAQAWGTPTTGPGFVPSEAAEHAENIQAVRKAGSLLEATRARLGLGRNSPDDPHGVRL